MHKSATRCQNSWSMSNLPDATDPGGKKNGGPVLNKYEHNSRSPIPLWSARWTKFCMQSFFLDWLKWTKVQKIHAKNKVSAKKVAISSNDCFGGENTFSKFHMIWKCFAIVSGKNMWDASVISHGRVSDFKVKNFQNLKTACNSRLVSLRLIIFVFLKQTTVCWRWAMTCVYWLRVKEQHPRTERTESKLHRPLQKNKLSFVPITGSWHVIRDMFLWQHSPPIPSVCSKFSHIFCFTPWVCDFLFRSYMWLFWQETINLFCWNTNILYWSH